MGFQTCDEKRVDASAPHQVFHCEVATVELTDCQCDTVDAARWDDRCDPTAIRQPGIEDGLLLRDVVAKSSGDVLNRDRQRFLTQGEPRHRLKCASPLNEDVSRAVHHDFAYGVIADQVLDRPQERKDGFKTEH